MIFRSRFAAHSGLGVRRERKTIVSSNPVISVVDDDVSVRVATDNLLSALGYIVHTFASAEDFLRSTHFSDTSCVIADVQMPTMSGVELQALLLARGQRLPFIFITAFPDESVRARVQKSGAICLLTKPFDRHSLIKCLDTALQRHADGTGE
jgi:FixJ family two-component response regulator